MNQTLHQDFVQNINIGELYQEISKTIPKVKTTKPIPIEEFLKNNSKVINQTEDQIAALNQQITAEPRVKP